MVSKKLAKVKVFKFDPVEDKKPRYEAYEVPYDGRSVLDVLQYIQENHDPALSFRFGCAGGGYERCGCCAILVNGTPALSCKTRAQEEMLLEPHFKFEVIKDLAIDFEREKKRKKPTPNRPAVEITVDRDKCNACRDCVLICPVKVYQIQRVDKTAKSVPLDVASCCGLTCRQCALYCPKGAITVKAV